MHSGIDSAFLCLYRNGEPSEPVFLTAFFAFFIFLSAFNSFNARTPMKVGNIYFQAFFSHIFLKLNIFDHILENTGFIYVEILIFLVQVVFTYLGGSILRTVGLTFNEWVMVTGASMIIVPFDLLRKFLMKSLLGNNHKKTKYNTLKKN